MAAAPAAGVAGEAAGLLTTIMGWAIAFGLLLVYRNTLSKLLTGLADVLDGAAVNAGIKTVHIFGPLSSALRGLDGQIKSALAGFVSLTERGIVFFWNALTESLDFMAKFLVDLAETVEERFGKLLWAFPPAAVLVATVESVRALSKLPALVATVYHAATVTLPRTIGRVGGRVGRLEKEAVRTGKRLRRAEAYLTAAGAAVIFMTALKRLRLGWLRCSNVGKLGRRACAMDATLLDALIADTFVLFGSFSLVEFARELASAEDEIASAVHGFFRVR